MNMIDIKLFMHVNVISASNEKRWRI